MGRADYYKPGDFNRICERTGFKVKASQTKKEWNNRIVRAESFEPRQPQDLLRSRPDRQQVPDPRTESSDSFVDTNEVLEIYAGQSLFCFSAGGSPAVRLITSAGGGCLLVDP